jgi:drug/metabolite transporter (DMT)-like permease
MAVLLGVLVAASFGSGDFLGGRASRRAPTLTVLFVAQSAAVLGAVIVCLFVGARVQPHDIVYGALAGCFNIVGLGLLYQGLAVGRMGVVAPLTAVVASIVPVVWGIATGERPAVVVLVGVALALIAAALIARRPNEPIPDLPREIQPDEPQAMGVGWSVCSGAFFGISLVLYVQTSSGSGLFPVLAARIAAFVLVTVALVVVAARGHALPFPNGPDRTLSLGAGMLDVTAGTLLLLAVRHGLIVVVAPIAALGPAATVILARSVLGERLHAAQRVGLAFALLGLVMIAVG